MNKYWIYYKEKMNSYDEPEAYKEGSCFIVTDDIESWWYDTYGKHGDILLNLVIVPEEV